MQCELHQARTNDGSPRLDPDVSSEYRAKGTCREKGAHVYKTDFNSDKEEGGSNPCDRETSRPRMGDVCQQNGIFQSCSTNTKETLMWTGGAIEFTTTLRKILASQRMLMARLFVSRGKVMPCKVQTHHKGRMCCAKLHSSPCRGPEVGQSFVGGSSDRSVPIDDAWGLLLRIHAILERIVAQCTR